MFYYLHEKTLHQDIQTLANYRISENKLKFEIRLRKEYENKDKNYSD